MAAPLRVTAFCKIAVNYSRLSNKWLGKASKLCHNYGYMRTVCRIHEIKPIKLTSWGGGKQQRWAIICFTCSFGLGFLLNPPVYMLGASILLDRAHGYWTCLGCVIYRLLLPKKPPSDSWLLDLGR